MQTTTIFNVILIIALALAIALFHYYYKSKRKEKVSVLLAFLRFIALASLLLLWYNPQVEFNVETIEKPKLLVAIDNSNSIEFLEQKNTTIDIVDQLVSNTKIQEKFEVSYYTFGEEVRLLDSLTFDEVQTNISKPIQQLNRIYKNTVAPVVLITDGNQTYGNNYVFESSKQPIYPLVVGDTTVQEDVYISQLNVNKYSFLKNTFPVEIFINYEGTKARNFDFSIYKNGKRVYKEAIVLSKESTSTQVSLTLPSGSIGKHIYKAVISTFDGEKNQFNNTKEFVVEVVDEQSKVLILTSVIHPDIGALKAAITSNEQRNVDIVTIDTPVALEQYQTIVLYQPNRMFQSVFETLIRTKKNYLLITGLKTDWSFLNTVQSDFSKQAIRKQESYWGVFNPNFNSFIVDDIGFEKFPPLDDFFGTVSFNLTPNILLFQELKGYQTEQPLLATYKKGEQRIGVLFGENSWRWRMQSYIHQQRFTNYDAFIGKLIQYLSTNKYHQKLSIDVVANYYSNDIVRIKANYVDENFVFDTTAQLEATLIHKETGERIIRPFQLKNSYYEVTFQDLLPGEYSYKVAAVGTVENSRGTFKVLDFGIEQQFSSANYDQLVQLSLKHNGEVFLSSEYKECVKSLLEDKRYSPILKTSEKKDALINWYWLMGLIIISLSLEWFIRKYRGLI